MTFNYFNKIYIGTRPEIQESLMPDLKFFNLEWVNGFWSLSSEKSNRDCSPSEARKQLEKQIIDKVPGKRIARIVDDYVIITTEGEGKRISIYDL